MSIGHSCGYLNVSGFGSRLYHPVLLRMRTSSSGCTCFGLPYGLKHWSTSVFAVCSAVVFLLQWHTRVKRDRPQAATRRLS